MNDVAPIYVCSQRMAFEGISAFLFFSRLASPLNRFIVCVYASLVSYGLMVFVDLVKKNLDFEEKSVFFSILLNKHFCVTVRECSEHPLFSGL